jgi:hypothetical protein
MHGSADDYPLSVGRQLSRTLLAMTALILAPVIGLVWQGGSLRAAMITSAVIFVASLPGWALLFHSFCWKIVIDGSGFTQSYRRRVTRFEWDQVESLELVCTKANPETILVHLSCHLDRDITGNSGDHAGYRSVNLASGWELGPQKLLTLLTECKKLGQDARKLRIDQSGQI